mmetsp:Transcript_15968/g.34713  ORF Transcript_15968/g.34713 Transcript_15968/m.34713 type:complete len:692 (+) Transcript_15968:85-2160(+)|eukprot:CAMPEP_0178522252 /NCGR_PEP_ID=MMETSP0696-20121128/28433_1 /TAXON_ID=265572 /ORGANISM="Extubocellulus spinifer, Strain CCMP396" /LENGTH=691 /DNA_ID=CAMNT_0020153353 /DNA_START=26 /DNA_END=2101 /DNA_ORIENTATION=+
MTARRTKSERSSTFTVSPALMLCLGILMMVASASAAVIVDPLASSSEDGPPSAARASAHARAGMSRLRTSPVAAAASGAATASTARGASRTQGAPAAATTGAAGGSYESDVILTVASDVALRPTGTVAKKDTQQPQGDGTARAASTSRVLRQSIVGDGNDRKDGGRKEAKDVMLNLLTDLVYSGTELDEGERNLIAGDPTLSDLQDAHGEISDYYWRQLRYASSHSYLYDPEPEHKPASRPAKKPDYQPLPSEVTCTIVKDDGAGAGGGGGHTGRSDDYDGNDGGKDDTHTVVVEFQYNVECTGYVDNHDYDALDYAILKEAAEGNCVDSKYEWDDRRRRGRELGLSSSSLSSATDSTGTSAGPNSVVDILRDELMDDEDVNTASSSQEGSTIQQRKLEIVSIDADPEDERTGRCEPTTDAAKEANCCQERTGYVTVTYNGHGNNSNEDEVTANVLRKIKDAMDDTCDDDNAFEHYGRADSNIECVIYIGPNPDAYWIPSVEQVMATTTEGLTAGQKGGIAAAALLLALLALLAARKMRNRPSSDKSVNTDILDGDSYCTADYGNLGGRHSKLDVHRCRSALCKGCTAGRVDLCDQRGGGGGNDACLPVVDEESDQIVKDLAAIKDRDVVFLRTQGIAPGQLAEHVDIDLERPSSPPPPAPADGPAYVEQEDLVASLDINRVGSASRARII